MPQSLAKIMLHITFSTKKRVPLIIDEVEKNLHAYIASMCNALGCHAYRVGGTSNHIHIACRLSRTITVSDLLEDIKSHSSKWMKKQHPLCAHFSWQNGYGAFSMSESHLKRAVTYIDNQKEHHREKTFEVEYLGLLKEYDIEYDERYVWD
jgi:putative transposase